MEGRVIGDPRGRSPWAGADGSKRLLIYIPILHTQADMGRLAPSVRRVTEQRLGREAWKKSVDVVSTMWAELRRTVEGWDLSWTNVRLYQDGLPECGREAEIVTTLARAGSPNHQLLLLLMARGAHLMGTESPELLMEEYRLMQEELVTRARGAASSDARRQARALSLLARRDRSIAGRINRTLRRGEVGLLFLGMLHSPKPYLAKDIQVVCPIRRPPRVREAAR